MTEHSFNKFIEQLLCAKRPVLATKDSTGQDRRGPHPNELQSCNPACSRASGRLPSARVGLWKTSMRRTCLESREGG